MLCGRLPFEDEHVPALFQKIASGVRSLSPPSFHRLKFLPVPCVRILLRSLLSLQRYHVPKYLSEDAKFLIAGMLVVDPMKRLTVQDLLMHRWTNENLPEYMKRMKTQLNPQRSLDTLTSLLDASASENSPDYIEDVGILDYEILQELAGNLAVPPSLVRTALETEGENAVKVAYKLIQDRALGHNRKPSLSPCACLSECGVDDS